ncbi:MAG TPA: hypothetical protein VEF76_12300 [Patescibacteria group bacterium]|nr:hypothetical protein [Patescibacteria group bacterium]
MKSVFNWLAEKPAKQWTLGEALLGAGTGYELSRGARLVERTLTLGGIFASVASFAFGSSGGPQPLDYLVGGKAFGLIGATITELTLRGIKSHQETEQARVQEMGRLIAGSYCAGLGSAGAAKMGVKSCP